MRPVLDVVVACPEGESHEIGAQAAAYSRPTGDVMCIISVRFSHRHLAAFCERVKPDLVLLSLTEVKSDAAARHLMHELESLSTQWPVGIGGQGALRIQHLLKSRKIELLDDLTALHNRLTILLSNRMLSWQR